ncbi:MAG: zinc ribbon domain-containing protein [Thermoanaerobaculia bacterium]|nr:zinc ribbon domain-containing protein [Thermoanaerobaculia bacterium]
MPLREFRCTDCGNAFEMILSSGESVSCPECGSRDLQRLISSFAVRGGSSPARVTPSIPSGGT